MLGCGRGWVGLTVRAGHVREGQAEQEDETAVPELDVAFLDNGISLEKSCDQTFWICLTLRNCMTREHD